MPGDNEYYGYTGGAAQWRPEDDKPSFIFINSQVSCIMINKVSYLIIQERAVYGCFFKW